MLASLNSLKSKLGITGNEEDDLLGAILGRSDAIAKRIMNRAIEAVNYTEIADGHGEQIMQLKHFPVITITSLKFRDTPAAAWKPVDHSDYSVKRETGEIRFPNLRLMRGFENVRITYRAGYESVPAEIEEAVLQIAAASYNRRNTDGIIRERLDGAEIQYSENQTPSEAEAILLSYRPYYV